MRKLSCSWVVVALVAGGLVGCGGETPAGSQNGPGGQAGSAQAGSGGSAQAGSSQAGKGGSAQAGSSQAGKGGSSQAGQGGSASCSPPSTLVRVCIDGSIESDCFGPNAGAPPPFEDCGGGTCVPDGAMCPGPGGAGGGTGGKGGSAGTAGKGGSAGATGGSGGSGGSTGTTCGGIAGLQCAKDEFCDFDDSMLCGAADAAGVCRKKPQACDDSCIKGQQVCDCSGKVYCKACDAQAQGIDTIPCQGECKPPNTQALTCVEGKVTAVCLGPTDGIPAPYQDCGGGTCVPDGQKCAVKTCGGFGGLKCADNEFCSYELKAQCGAFDATGVCMPRPKDCGDGCPSPEFSVCGCDGQKYCNECNANANGVSVTECKDQPKTCGGLLGNPCAADEFCDYENNAQCGATDQTGVCKPRPSACPASCAFVPVCGCDGKTYCNECDAQAAGTDTTACQNGGSCTLDDKASAACKQNLPDLPQGYTCSGTATPAADCKLLGEIGVYCCPGAADKVCGGFTGKTCADNEFCDYEDKAQCGAFDASGVCKPRPQACPASCALDALVCGCDGNKYCSACDAQSQGIDTQPCAGQGKEGSDCSASSQCGGGLLCCHACGTPECGDKCIKPDDGGKCPLFP